MGFIKRLFGAREPKDTIAEKIAYIASVLHDKVKFVQSAQKAALEIGEDNFDAVTRYINNPPDIPGGVDSRYMRQGDWILACHSAVFEILFNFKEKSIPLLYTYTFQGQGDEPRMAAFVLMRLATDGVKKEEILQNLLQHLDSLQEETIKMVVAKLSLIKDDDEAYTALDRIFDWYLEQDVTMAYFVMKHIWVCKEKEGLKYLFFLKRLARGKGLENVPDSTDASKFFMLEPELKEFAKKGILIPSYYYSVDAAQCLYLATPHDQEIMSMLYDWSENHQDPWVRINLMELLESTKDWREDNNIQPDENNFVPLRKKRTFKTLKIDKYGRRNNRLAYDRKYCAEAKLFEEYAHSIGSKFDTEGHINMATELSMCKSCQYVKQQFHERYPNIKVDLEITRPAKEYTLANSDGVKHAQPHGMIQYELSFPTEYVEIVALHLGALMNIPVNIEQIGHTLKNEGIPGGKCVCVFKKSVDDGSFILLDCWYNDTLSVVVVRCTLDIAGKVKLLMLKWDSGCRREYAQDICTDLDNTIDNENSAFREILKIHGTVV